MHRQPEHLVTGRGTAALALSLAALGVALGWIGPARAVGGVRERLQERRVTAIAEQARARCGRLAQNENVACYVDALLPLARAGRVRLAMASLERLAGLDPAVAYQAHAYAHAIGMEAVNAGRDPHETYEACTPLYDAGCYHGTIEMYLRSAAHVGAAELDAFCGPYMRPGVSAWHRYQCAHGIGHGLTMHHGYDLPPALDGCDLFADRPDREACYSGALMENITSVRYGPDSPMTFALRAAEPGAPTQPVHAHMAAAGGARDGAMREVDGHGVAGHEPGGATQDAAAPRFRPFDPADPYYPCSILAEKYAANCYHLQPSLSLVLNQLDYAATARMCDGAPEAMRSTCYHGLGNQITAQAAGDADDAIRFCALGSAAYQPWCYDGAVKSLVSVTHAPAAGFAFCALVPEGPNRTQCYGALGWEIAFLGIAAAEREALCAGAPPRDVEACRFGAGLSDTKPEGLTAVVGNE